MTEHQSRWADLLVRRIISAQLNFMWTNSRNLIKMNQRLKSIWVPFIAHSCCLWWYSRKGQSKRVLTAHPAHSQLRGHKGVWLTAGSIPTVHTKQPLPAGYPRKTVGRWGFRSDGTFYYSIRMTRAHGSLLGLVEACTGSMGGNAHRSLLASWASPWRMARWAGDTGS